MEYKLKKAFEAIGVDTRLNLSVVEPVDFVNQNQNLRPNFSKAQIDMNGKSVEVLVVDPLVKSNIFSSWSDTSQFAVEVTGKELLPKLVSLRDNNMIIANGCLEKAKAVLSKLSVVPTNVDRDEYMFRGTRSKFPAIPPMFDWETIDKEERSSSMDQIVAVGEPEAKAPIAGSSSELMRQYNMHARAYIEYMVEYYLTEVIIGTIDEKKKYKLSLEQAAGLGF